MEITYIKKGKEKTLKGWKAHLFLFGHILEKSHGDIEYYFKDTQFLHIKNAKFKTKGDFIFSSSSCHANLILEACEFSCSGVEMKRQDVIQFTKNSFKKDTNVYFFYADEVDLDLMPGEKKLSYYVEDSIKLTVKGNGKNTSMNAFSSKAQFSHVSSLSVENSIIDNLEVFSSDIVFKRCSFGRTFLKDSEVYGTNLYFPILSLQDSKIESDESLKIKETKYFSKEKDGKVTFCDEIVLEPSLLHVCSVNHDIKLEKISSLLSLFKALEMRCTKTRAKEIADNVSRQDMDLKIQFHKKKIEEYKRQIEEQEKLIQREEERMMEMKKNVRICVEETPMKRILK